MFKIQNVNIIKRNKIILDIACLIAIKLNYYKQENCWKKLYKKSTKKTLLNYTTFSLLCIEINFKATF